MAIAEMSNDRMVHLSTAAIGWRVELAGGIAVTTNFVLFDGSQQKAAIGAVEQ